MPLFAAIPQYKVLLSNNGHGTRRMNAEARLKMCPVELVRGMFRHEVISIEGINVLSLSRVLKEG